MQRLISLPNYADKLSLPFVYTNVNVKATPNTVYLVDTSDDIVNIILPHRPLEGSRVIIVDEASNFDVNKCAVIVEGSASDVFECTEPIPTNLQDKILNVNEPFYLTLKDYPTCLIYFSRNWSLYV